MADRKAQEETQGEGTSAGQNQDSLAELQAKEPALHTAKHHGARDGAAEGETQSANPPTAKDVDTVRGHDNPQSVRNAG